MFTLTSSVELLSSFVCVLSSSHFIPQSDSKLIYTEKCKSLITPLFTDPPTHRGVVVEVWRCSLRHYGIERVRGGVEVQSSWSSVRSTLWLLCVFLFYAKAERIKRFIDGVTIKDVNRFIYFLISFPHKRGCIISIKNLPGFHVLPEFLAEWECVFLSQISDVYHVHPILPPHRHPGLRRVLTRRAALSDLWCHIGMMCRESDPCCRKKVVES